MYYTTRFAERETGRLTWTETRTDVGADIDRVWQRVDPTLGHGTSLMWLVSVA